MIQEFVHQVNATINSVLNGIHTVLPGEIIAFDPNTGLATVRPVMKFKKANGETIDFPQIMGVPVLFPQGNGQGATIAFPVKAGDGCMILVAERSIDYWMYEQETATELAFDLTNALCIPGLFRKANPVVKEACDRNAVVVDVKGTRLTVQSGAVTITAPTVTVNGNLQVNGKVDATGDVVGSGVSLGSHSHGCSMGGTSGPG